MSSCPYLLVSLNQYYNQVQIVVLNHKKKKKNTNDGARSDVSVKSFLMTGQKAFF